MLDGGYGMKAYDLINIGTGSGLSVVEQVLNDNPNLKVAVIDKDGPGGICLTRGCIPSKMLLYPAELVRLIEKAKEFGIEIDLKEIRFDAIMDRMRKGIEEDAEQILRGLEEAENVDFYQAVAKFVAPYTLDVNGTTISARTILLCTGSRPGIPPVEGLEETGYLTSDSLLSLTDLPHSIAVIGGGYIAAEYGHFFASMGSEVTIIGRNPQFIPEEEPEISAIAMEDLQKHLTILTGQEAVRVEKTPNGKKRVLIRSRDQRREGEVIADEILVASGRSSNTDILQPERGGIETDHGWIKVNQYLETSQPGVWALGDATGSYMFKHVANYEAEIVYANAFRGKKIPVDYRIVPHAVFTYPEIAAVGMKEKDAIQKYGRENIRIGIERYEDTGKGRAMAAKNWFVKIIVEGESRQILGAHIIGPYASILIQEVVNLLYTDRPTTEALEDAMHIHPAMSEVVQRAISPLMGVEEYHHLMEEHYKFTPSSLRNGPS
jgi:mycothione reductase